MTKVSSASVASDSRSKKAPRIWTPSVAYRCPDLRAGLITPLDLRGHQVAMFGGDAST